MDGNSGVDFFNVFWGWMNLMVELPLVGKTHEAGGLALRHAKRWGSFESMDILDDESWIKHKWGRIGCSTLVMPISMVIYDIMIVVPHN